MKIGVIILARANYGRWPDKVLFQLQGKTILEHVITKAQTLNVDHVIVSTTYNPKDKPIREIIVKTNCDVSLGEPDDRTSRICQAITDYDLDYIIYMSPAQPFFDVEYMNLLIKAYNDNPGYELYRNGAYHHGFVMPIFKATIPFNGESPDEEVFYAGIKKVYFQFKVYDPAVKNRYLFNCNIAYKIQGENHRRICEYLGHFPENYEEVTDALLGIELQRGQNETRL